MKSTVKLVALGVILCVNCGFAVTMLFEGFNDATIPAGWAIDVVSNYGSQATFYYVTRSSYPTTALTPYEGERFLRFNSFSAWAGNKLRMKCTNSFATTGFPDVRVALAWSQDYNLPQDNDYMTLQWSTNGTDWIDGTNYYRWIGDTSVSVAWYAKEYRLPPAAIGKKKVYLALLFNSEYGIDCHLDAVTVFENLPRVELSPAYQNSVGYPGRTISVPLSVVNKTLSNDTFNLSYTSTWAATGPAHTGFILNEISNAVNVQITAPASAYAGQVCTTIVTAVNAINGLYTNTAMIITVCSWKDAPLYKPFADSTLAGWTNYVQGSGGTLWTYRPADMAFHTQNTISSYTNWLVSPMMNCNFDYETLQLSFAFGIWVNLVKPEGIYVSTNNPNPMLNDYKKITNIFAVGGYYTQNLINMKNYIGISNVYIALPYIANNSSQFLANVYVTAEKTGINNAVLDSPAAISMNSYETTPMITGLLYIAGKTGASGPASNIAAQIGFGVQGTWPATSAWYWFDAPYCGASGDYDVFATNVNATFSGNCDFAYRFKVGAASWVYADLNCSSNGFSSAQAGKAAIAMLPPHGDQIFTVTISPDWSIGAGSYYSYTNDIMYRYYEVADDMRFTYRAVIQSLRWGGLYYGDGRKGTEKGFWLRIYDNSPTNTPGAVLYQEFKQGYACEQWFAFNKKYNLYKYHADLATPFITYPGSTYWFAVQEEVVTNTRWGRLDSPMPSSDYSALQRSSETNPWLSWGTNMGVEVYGVATNAAVISGTITAAHSGAPLGGAVVQASNALITASAATGTNGQYALTMPNGAYVVSAAAANYAPASFSGIMISNSASVRQDIVLSGSLLTYAPASISNTLYVGEICTNIVYLTNSGPLTVNYTLGLLEMFSQRALKAADIHLPRSDRNFTHSAPLCGRAPRNRVGRAESPVAAMINSPSVLAYGVKVNTDPNVLLAFYTGTPNIVNTIGSTSVGAGAFICGADFVGGDYSQLYCLVLGSNQLVKVNTANGATTIIGTAYPGAACWWNGLVADSDGTLYATSSGLNGTQLFTINKKTGSATLVGTLTNAIGVITVVGIAISPSGQMYGLDIKNDNLLRIDKHTCRYEVVGSIGFDANYAQGMDFDDENNVLYLAAYNLTLNAAELRVADTDTGNTVSLGLISDGYLEVDGFAIATRRPLDWVTLSKKNGSFPAGIDTLNLVFDARTVGAGVYHGNMFFDGTYVNDVPDMPLTLEVLPEPAALSLLIICVLSAWATKTRS